MSDIQRAGNFGKAGRSRIRQVGSFEELLKTAFEDGINALCWQRNLTGNFAEIASHFRSGPDLVSLSETELRRLPLSEGGQCAATVMLEDFQLLKGHGLQPELNAILNYPREPEEVTVRTDVYSFHADRATAPAETWLCTYHGASSEGVANEDAVRHVDVPEIRAALRQEFEASRDDDFTDFLQENCYDLHYALLPRAVPYSFGVGNLWKIAVAYPGCPVPPCIHRAPEPLPGAPPRLLLIS